MKEREVVFEVKSNLSPLGVKIKCFFLIVFVCFVFIGKVIFLSRVIEKIYLTIFIYPLALKLA